MIPGSGNYLVDMGDQRQLEEEVNLREHMRICLKEALAEESED